MLQHPQRRSALIWSGVVLVGIILIFLPGIIGLEGNDGGYALSFLGGFMALIGIIAALIYFKLARTIDNIIKKENVLAHWNYTSDEWQKYTETERKESGSYRANIKDPSEAIIALDGVHFNRQLHVWKGMGATLDEIAFESEPGQQPRIRIEYSTPSRSGRNDFSVHIPVPQGQEKAAQKIVADIAAVHMKKEGSQ
jgi:hypothetical protein